MQTTTNKMSSMGRVAGLVLCFVVALTFSTLSFADRILPTNAKLGVLSPSAKPNVVIDGQLVKLSGGAQIRNEKNMIIQTATLAGPDVNVLYQIGLQGQVHRIWILTPVEYQRISAAINK